VIRFGIHCRKQLTPDNIAGFFGKRKPVAVTLYPLVAAEDTPETDRLLEHILARFATDSGAFKRTHRSRFPEFDAAVLQIVRESLTHGTFRTHDLGASDGRTSVEFFGKLAELEQHRLEFVASDYAPNVQEVSREGCATRIILDPRSKKLLQTVRPPFVFNVTRRESPLLFPLNRCILRYLLKTKVLELLDQLQSADDRVQVKEIPLLHPATVRLIHDDARFRFERYDVLTPTDQSYDLVRAMNVLNRAYFSSSQICRAVAFIYASLNPGGIFVVGSNSEARSRVRGTIYRKTGSGFESLFISHGGSEINDEILTFASDSEAARGE
jgi:chemotaxis methyl-accepting protein methylase